MKFLTSAMVAGCVYFLCLSSAVSQSQSDGGSINWMLQHILKEFDADDELALALQPIQTVFLNVNSSRIVEKISIPLTVQFNKAASIVGSYLSISCRKSYPTIELSHLAEVARPFDRAGVQSISGGAEDSEEVAFVFDVDIPFNALNDTGCAFAIGMQIEDEIEHRTGELSAQSCVPDDAYYKCKISSLLDRHKGIRIIDILENKKINWNRIDNELLRIQGICDKEKSCEIEYFGDRKSEVLKISYICIGYGFRGKNNINFILNDGNVKFTIGCGSG